MSIRLRQITRLIRERRGFAMKLHLYQIDAFTNDLFRGNPAAVCPLREWLPDAMLQTIAAENNLSETAFIVGAKGQYDIRWLTPTMEVDLCGHATLASAFVVFERLEPRLTEVQFASRSGQLHVVKTGDRYVLDFPSRPPEMSAATPEIIAALGNAPAEVGLSRDILAVFTSENEIRDLRPDLALVKKLGRAVIVTAPGSECDFVSRFFAPVFGIDEDPVTGSAHCTLVPYWARRLGRRRLHARQLSPRGGELFCEDRGERILIGGRAVCFLEGVCRLPVSGASRLPTRSLFIEAIRPENEPLRAGFQLVNARY
jgi:PhzF family phenazine biosynthesis protein